MKRIKWGHSVQRIHFVPAEGLSQGQWGKDFEQGPDVTRNKPSPYVEVQVTFQGWWSGEQRGGLCNGPRTDKEQRGWP